MISDIIEKRIKCNGNTEEKGPKGEIFMSFQLKLKPKGRGKFLQAQTGVGDGNGKAIYNARHYRCSVSTD